MPSRSDIRVGDPWYAREKYGNPSEVIVVARGPWRVVNPPRYGYRQYGSAKYVPAVSKGAKGVAVAKRSGVDWYPAIVMLHDLISVEDRKRQIADKKARDKKVAEWEVEKAARMARYAEKNIRLRELLGLPIEQVVTRWNAEFTELLAPEMVLKETGNGMDIDIYRRDDGSLADYRSGDITIANSEPGEEILDKIIAALEKAS